jgi:uncharacterized protein YehS (DUF1456 family)
MARNELLRGIRDTLKIDDTTMTQIFSQAGRTVGQSTVAAFLQTEDHDDYIPCSDPILGFFLDGLIIHNRGKQEESPTPVPKPAVALTNNAIFKKLRIALDLKEDDLTEIFKRAGRTVSKHELTALFRKQGHKHYKECNNQLFNDFMRGLALRNTG